MSMCQSTLPIKRWWSVSDYSDEVRWEENERDRWLKKKGLWAWKVGRLDIGVSVWAWYLGPI